MHLTATLPQPSFGSDGLGSHSSDMRERSVHDGAEQARPWLGKRVFGSSRPSPAMASATRESVKSAATLLHSGREDVSSSLCSWADRDLPADESLCVMSERMSCVCELTL